MWSKYKEKILSYSPEILFISILTIVVYLAPFATYSYNGAQYDIPGYGFLTGMVIYGGRITLSSQPLMGINILLAAILFLSTILGRKRKVLYGVVCTGSGLLMTVMNLVLRSKVGGMLEKAANVKSSFGMLLLVVFGVIVLLKGILVLFEAKKIIPYDLMILPGFIYLLINCYIPMFGIILAFKEVNYTKGVFRGDWIGFKNFKYLFADLPMLLRNTLSYNIVFIIVGNCCAIFVAVCLSEVFSTKLKKIYQTSILLPNLISIVVIAYIVYGFLSTDAGWINNNLVAEGKEINFYSTKKYWPFILVMVNVWKGVGYDAIIYLSSIVGIDRTIYEAAMVDGCGKIKQFFMITLPLLKPTIVTLLLLAMGRIINSDFGLFYQVPMNSGPLTAVTQTIDTYVYKALMANNDIGRATAAGAFQSIVGFVLVMVSNRCVRKADDELSLF